MRIFFSGIGGVGIGPLAEIARGAGYDVLGSDKSESLLTNQLKELGISVSFNQDGSALEQAHTAKPVDWFVYTTALPSDHPELVFAKNNGIKATKRDELLAHIIAEKQLKLIAVAGTHGKTTTTGMLIWAFQQLDIPASYSVGTTLSFGPSGKFDRNSQYFIYECDEFDRNFLHFSPWLSLITYVDYDHPDIFPTREDYRAAFRQFGQQSERVVAWRENADIFDSANLTVLDEAKPNITLPGIHNRKNATLVLKAAEEILTMSIEEAVTGAPSPVSRTPQAGEATCKEYSERDIVRISSAINSFPGTGRRFEKLADNLYSDYGHHPVEIAATLQMARELSSDVVLVYQPHQNIRQHEVRHQYTPEIFANTNQVYWVPTYLSREDPNLTILTPQQLTEQLPPEKVHIAELNDQLWQAITKARQGGRLVLCMGAGSIDGWLRQQLNS